MIYLFTIRKGFGMTSETLITSLLREVPCYSGGIIHSVIDNAGTDASSDVMLEIGLDMLEDEPVAEVVAKMDMLARKYGFAIEAGPKKLMKRPCLLT